MGLCFSRKKSPSPPPDPASKCIPNEKKVEKKNEKERGVAAQPAAKAAAETKPVFVVTQKGKKKGETPTKKIPQKEDGSNGRDRSPLAVAVPPAAPVRTSSCTKEEMDAALIQCGRLSQSSSEKASNANGGGHRKCSGSKRSYDFDHEKKGDEDWEKPISRPSPHRRTPGRERSGIRERSSGGGRRRASRSPGRRSEVPTSSGSPSDRSRQPAKMVSVPAREKGSGSSAVADRRGGERRSASPRSRSPANTTRTGNENTLHHNPQPQSLGRSSLRKAEQSPCRRSPMAEIDDNSLRGDQAGGSNYKAQKTEEGGEEGLRKLSQSHTQKASENIAQMRKFEQRDGGAVAVSNGLRSKSNAISNSVREQLMSCRARDGPLETAMVEGAVQVEGAPTDGEAPLTSVGAESLNPRTTTRCRSLKRSSRDFDHAPGPNPECHLDPTSCTSFLLEDIHNYHQRSAAFSLPACVSKACSILEAVADLNSSCSENRSSRPERSDNNNGALHGRFGRRRGLVPKGPFIEESEIIARDDLMEPGLHKYVSVRDLGGEMEPQESAGSNSFIGQPWSSPWEPNSIDSTDRDWTSHSNNGDEVEQQRQESMPGIALDSEARGRRLRGGSSSSNSLPTTTSSGCKERDSDHHRRRRRGRSGFGGGGGSGKAGGTRSSSLPGSSSSSNIMWR
ncbi:serine/threonine-protein kinase PRP4 homolog [Phoenix dactylifera]|uniref:Serine/threonine-protein kinase PRP4 homolog n=1 Tax=Phoenix dactylifera TaxID=42345 RepID=A0A8B7BNB0_PHODC|nr:serine/threonine-protein kinase PRP4 homolog [Phoenix dactylifera]